MNEQRSDRPVAAGVPDAQVSVSLNGGHVDISVTSSVLRDYGLLRVSSVYAPLASLIADGTLHAVNISAQTP